MRTILLTIMVALPTIAVVFLLILTATYRRFRLNSLAGSWDAIIHAALSRAYVCRPRWLRALR